MIIEVYKRTNDWWYPSYKLPQTDLVQVSFMKLDSPGPDTWRVCAWGDDDYGFEKDFTNEKEALDCFMDVIGLECVIGIT